MTMENDYGKGEMFVNDASGVVHIISDRTRQVVATIPLGNNPYPGILIYDSGKGEIFVGYGSGYEPLPGQNPADFMSAISDSTNSVVATIPLSGNIVISGAYDPTTSKLYMINPFINSILVISDQTNSVVNSIPDERTPVSVGYDSNKGVLFVGNSDDTTSIVSDKTETIIETAPISSGLWLYDSGRKLMVSLGNASIQFVSDDSLPSVSPKSTIPELSVTIALPLLILISLVAFKVKQRKHEVSPMRVCLKGGKFGVISCMLRMFWWVLCAFFGADY